MSIEAKGPDARPQQSGPRVWLIFFRRYLLVSASGHTLWELLHLPLYTISQAALSLRVGLFLGSGLIDQSQKMTIAAMQMADMKVWAHRS